MTRLPYPPDFRRIETANLFASLFVLTDKEHGIGRPLPENEPWPLMPESELPNSAHREESLRRWNWNTLTGGRVISLPVMRGATLAREHILVGYDGHVERHRAPEILIHGVPFLPFEVASVAGSAPAWITAYRPHEHAASPDLAVPEGAVSQALANEEFVTALRQVLSEAGHDFDSLSDEQKRRAARQFLAHIQKQQSEQTSNELSEAIKGAMEAAHASAQGEPKLFLAELTKKLNELGLSQEMIDQVLSQFNGSDE